MKRFKIVSWETLLFILYTGLMLITVLHHEPWRDEAQAWLIARDLPLVLIFKQMAYEGTPALWHTILIPFAKLGLPYLSINLIHLVIICFAAAVFVYKSPFPILTKTLFLFSFYMAWEYSIVARNYSLSVLLLFLIASIYRDRFRKPISYAVLIVLLFNTNMHSFFIAAALLAVFLYEIYEKRSVNQHLLPAVFSMFLGPILVFLQLLSPADNVRSGLFSTITLFKPLIAIKNAFLPNLPIPAYIGVTAGALVLLTACIYFIKISRTALFLLLFSYVGLFYIFMFQNGGENRHHGFFLLLLVFVLWISNYYKEKDIPDRDHQFVHPGKFIQYGFVLFLINVFLAIGIIPAASNHYQEYYFLFSGAKEMAGYIERNNLEDNTIIAHRSPHASSLSPYLPETDFWYADIEDYGTFIIWNLEWANNQEFSFEEIINRIKRNNFAKETTLILLNEPIPGPEVSDYQLLHEVRAGEISYGDESYYLYKER